MRSQRRWHARALTLARAYTLARPRNASLPVYDVKVLDDGVVAVKRERRALPQQ